MLEYIIIFYMENETFLTEEMYKKFIRNQTKVSTIIIRVCYIILLAFGLISVIASIIEPEVADWFFTGYCLILGVLFMLYDIFLVPLNLKLSKSKNIIGCNYHFVFNENAFELTVKKDGNLISQSKASYDLIYKVIFLGDYIFIYLNRVTAYIVDKNGFKSDEDRLGTVNILMKYANNKQTQKKF